MHYSVNQIFHNRYKLLKLVGEGGMSQVWKAEDTITDAELAIKIFNYEGNLNNHAKESFRREFKQMFNIHHPNLFRPSHFDIEPDHQAPYLISKYFERGSAEHIINNSGDAIDEIEIAHFIRDAALALSVLHSLTPPIIHQDIKPDNFLIDDDGKFVLADFGVSTRKRETRLINQGEQNEDTFAGDTPYVSPERFSGAFPRPEQDIFSLGVTVYEILTGVLPFQHFGGRLLNHGHDVPDLDAAFGYTARLNTLCRQCMHPDPDARPDAAKLLDWSGFYLKNGYWPEIKAIDTTPIKAKKLANEATLVFKRLQTQKLDQIDPEELTMLSVKLNQVMAMTNDFPECGEQLKQLKLWQADCVLFEAIEKEFKQVRRAEIIDTKKAKALLEKIEKIKEKVTSRFFESRKTEIEALVSNRKDIEVLRTQIAEIFAKPFLSITADEISDLLKKCEAFQAELNNEIQELQLLLIKVNDYWKLTLEYIAIKDQDLGEYNSDHLQNMLERLKFFDFGEARKMLNYIKKKHADAIEYDAISIDLRALKRWKNGYESIQELKELLHRWENQFKRCNELSNKYIENKKIGEFWEILSGNIEKVKNRIEELEEEKKGAGKPIYKDGVTPKNDSIEKEKKKKLILWIGGVVAIFLTVFTLNVMNADSSQEDEQFSKVNEVGVAVVDGFPNFDSTQIVDTAAAPNNAEAVKATESENSFDKENKAVDIATNNPPSGGESIEVDNRSMPNTENDRPSSVKDEDNRKPISAVVNTTTETKNTTKETLVEEIKKPIPVNAKAEEIVNKTSDREKPKSVPPPPKINFGYSTSKDIYAGQSFEISCLAFSETMGKLTYRWEQIRGSSKLVDLDKPTLKIKSAGKGENVFRVTVIDENGQISSKEVTVMVKSRGM